MTTGGVDRDSVCEAAKMRDALFTASGYAPGTAPVDYEFVAGGGRTSTPLHSTHAQARPNRD